MSEYLRIPDRAIEHWNDHPRRAAAITVAAELRRIAPYLCEDDSISLQIRASELDPQGVDDA